MKARSQILVADMKPEGPGCECLVPVWHRYQNDRVEGGTSLMRDLSAAAVVKLVC